jgi:adenosylmethionine-8-amino-7-oxononanoate aminotransferase
MRFYSADYLRRARELCSEYNVLLIADEIATGFGRTGKLFACEWAGITPDIMCLGKALTGGYMTMAATLCSERVALGISAGEAGCFMHGPTFMGNPLAAATANASIDLLLSDDWAARVARIEAELRVGLAPLHGHRGVADVRCLGAIGVVELQQPALLTEIQPLLVERGVWLRPFGKLLYTMPPFVASSAEIAAITAAICEVVEITS